VDDTFTLAEVSLGIMAWRWFALVEKKERKEQQNLENWFERLRARPAFEKHGISIPLT
jgi:glutathione S-transferase